MHANNVCKLIFPLILFFYLILWTSATVIGLDEMFFCSAVYYTFGKIFHKSQIVLIKNKCVKSFIQQSTV